MSRPKERSSGPRNHAVGQTTRYSAFRSNRTTRVICTQTPCLDIEFAMRRLYSWQTCARFTPRSERVGMATGCSGGMYPRRSDTILYSIYIVIPRFFTTNSTAIRPVLPDVFVYIARIGEIDAMVVCENDNDHLNGRCLCQVYERYCCRNRHECHSMKSGTMHFLPLRIVAGGSFQMPNCRAYDAGACSRGCTAALCI